MKETNAFKGVRDKFSFIVESVPNGIVMTDEAGRIIFVNTSAGRMFGYKPSELVGRDIEILVPRRFSPTHVHYRDSFLASPSARPMGKGRDLYALRKDGSEFPVEIGLNPVDTKDGRVVLSTVVDITERKELEDRVLSRTEELARLNDSLRAEIRERELAEERQMELLHSLEKVNSELKDFAHRVSHDLKAPLRAIGALADWLREDYSDKLDESGVETLKLLKGRVVRMSNLIDGILSYTSAVREDVTLSHINMQELMDDVLGVLSVPEHINITFEPEVDEIYFDRTRLRQIFQNLLTNAIKYNDKAEGAITVTCGKNGDGYMFSVSDNGMGIEEKYFEKIFQMFQTLHHRDKSETAGIGLAIVKKILDNYNGRIWLESEPGEGSTFYFTIPEQDRQ